AGAGAPRHDDVEPCLDGGFQQLHHARGHGLAFDQIGGLQLVLREPADGHQRSVEGKRRYDDVHTRAVEQACIDHRIRLIHAAPDLGNDFVDDSQQVLIVTEDNVRQLQLTAAFDINLTRAVYQDVRDSGILQQGLQRTEPEHLVDNLVRDLLLL